MGATFLAVAVIVALLLVRQLCADRYRIVHAAFIPGMNREALPADGVVCYSSRDLGQAIHSTNILEQAGMTHFNLDASDLTAIVVSDHVFEQVVGQCGIGFIHVRKSATNGVSFTVVKGKKRLLQFAIGLDH